MKKIIATVRKIKVVDKVKEQTLRNLKKSHKNKRKVSLTTQARKKKTVNNKIKKNEVNRPKLERKEI